MKLSITIGIITHNRSKMLKACLKSIKEQTIKADKIVIVDTSEKKNTNLDKKLPIKYFHFKKRIRQPAARNIILKNTKTDIIAFLDDDTIATNLWLENIKEGFYISSNVVGVTGPAIDSTIGLKPINKIVNTVKNQNYFTFYGDIREKTRCWIPTKPIVCQIMLGANMAYKTNELKGVGGFTSFYEEGYGFREENFPQISLIKKKYMFIYMPKALVYHIKERTGGADKNFDHFYLCGKNHKILVDKFFPKIFSRLSWIFWSMSPPCIWLCLLLAIKRKDWSILRWHKGLWGL